MRRLVMFASLAAAAALPCCDGAAMDGAPPADGGAPAEAAGEDAGITSGAQLALAHPTRWVPAGGKASLDFKVARNGVAGALRVHIDRLPSGISATDVTLADSVSAGSIELRADTSAMLGAVATATVSLARETLKEDEKPLVVGVSGKPGDPDPTWGTAGLISLGIANADGKAIAVYPATAGADAGKVVVAGIVTNSATDVRLVLARYLVDGTLDATFGDLGSTIFDPGPSSTGWPTYVGGMKIDSKGRIVLANGRDLSGHCGVEVSRWTEAGKVDPSFARFSGSLDGSPCGEVVDLAVTTNDDVALLARWNEGAGNTVSLVQLFSGADGARGGDGYRLFLDSSGGEKSTRGYGLAVDASGRFVVAGAQCNGGWSSGKYDCSSMIARLTASGERDSSFGTKEGYTTFDFGTTNTSSAEAFRRVVVDPASGDPIAAGSDEGSTFGTLARVKAADGTAATFGSDGTLTRDLYAGAATEALIRPHVDSEGRIVFTGIIVTSGSDPVIVTGRAAADGTYDTTYGSGGVASTPGFGIDSALASDDRSYVVGTANAKIAVWRFWP